jgi:dTDP-4-dehydrorhamnose 3,5-epimerase-like enzyme
MLLEENKISELAPTFDAIAQVNLLSGVLGSLRGFHGADETENHWKVVTCVRGKVRDVALDLRIQSKTFGRCSYIDLGEEDSNSLVIPPGFAHAVQSLSNDSLTVYATNIPYSKNAEFEIYPLSEEFEFLWTLDPILSDRDQNAEKFVDFVERKSKGK